jgi:hypothetical protein
MTNEEMVQVHAQLVELAALSLNVELLDAYIERVRGGPVLDAAEHVDLALVVAGLQQVAHRLFTVRRASGASCVPLDAHARGSGDAPSSTSSELACATSLT